MPWEIFLRRRDDQPLGDVSQVCQGIEAALPETRFYREASGKEKMQAMTERGLTFPDAIREVFERQPAKTQAIYENDGLIIVFYGFETDPLQQLHAEIRGNGNPANALMRVCDLNAWQAIESSTGKTIDLRATTPSGWQSFLDFREHVVARSTGTDS